MDKGNHFNGIVCVISNSLPGVYHQTPPGFKEKRKLKCCLLVPVSSENTGGVSPWEISEFIE